MQALGAVRLGSISVRVLMLQCSIHFDDAVQHCQ
jgi:hypothetical protein